MREQSKKDSMLFFSIAAIGLFITMLIMAFLN